jgi:hypothetical protein
MSKRTSNPAKPSDLDDRIALDAAAWQVRLDGASESVRNEFLAWIGESTLHFSAFLLESLRPMASPPSRRGVRNVTRNVADLMRQLAEMRDQLAAETAAKNDAVNQMQALRRELMALREQAALRTEREFSSESFAQAAAKAQKGSEIRIMNTFIPNLPDIAPSLTDALDRGVSVKIAVLRSTCSEVKDRAATLGRDPHQVERQIVQTLDDIRDKVHAKTRAENRHLLSVRVVQCHLPFSMYATDGQMIVGNFWHGVLAVDGPQLVLSSRDKRFDSHQMEFNTIWKREDTEDLSISEWRPRGGRLQRKRSRN